MANRLYQILIERYGEHYARVNETITPFSIRTMTLQSWQLMYGQMVGSLPSGSRVLDVGCGTGRLLYWLSKQAGIIPIGIDSSPAQIEIAKQGLPGIELSCEDGLSYLQTHPDRFGGIFCTDVLEHVSDEDGCLAWIESVRLALCPNGFFVCRVPNGANLTASYARYIDLTHQRLFTKSSLLQLLEAGGLHDCRIIPVQAQHLTGRIRLNVEYFLHKLIFLICGRGLENVFTNNICMVGFKREP